MSIDDRITKRLELLEDTGWRSALTIFCCPLLARNALEMLRGAVAVLMAGRGAELCAGLPPKIGAHCGLCGALPSTWAYEIARSKEFDTWEQAQRVCRDMELDQMATKAAMDMLGISYDARQAREKARNN